MDILVAQIRDRIVVGTRRFGGGVHKRDAKDPIRMVNSEIRGCDGRRSLTRQRDSVEPERVHHGKDVLSELVDAVEPWRNDRIGCAETAAVQRNNSADRAELPPQPDERGMHVPRVDGRSPLRQEDVDRFLFAPFAVRDVEAVLRPCVARPRHGLSVRSQRAEISTLNATLGKSAPPADALLNSSAPHTFSQVCLERIGPKASDADTNHQNLAGASKCRQYSNRLICGPTPVEAAGNQTQCNRGVNGGNADSDGATTSKRRGATG